MYIFWYYINKNMATPTLSVRSLDINSSKDVDRFIKFAWQIYKNNP